MAKPWTAAARDVFLAHLAQTGNVSEAARLGEVSRTTAYAYRATHPAFARAWAEAMAAAVDALEQEARRRAVDGVEQPLVYGGKFILNPDGTVAKIRHYSDRLLVFLLTAHRPNIYEPTGEAGDDGKDDPLLTDEERANRINEFLNPDAKAPPGSDPAG